MAATETVANVIFPADMTNNDSWDPNVPYPAPLPIPDANNILAELSMYTSAINTPMPIPDNAPSPCSEHTDDGLFRTGPTKHGVKRTAAAASASASASASHPIKKAKHGKSEFDIFTEPVTPKSTAKPPLAAVCTMPVPAPMSPTCQSVCTDEADEVLSMPPTPVPADMPSLPLLTKEQSAKRRALRRATLKRNRSRKEEGSLVVKSEVGKCEGEGAGGGNEPLDKKAARAIRNREAAMKSRVEAKQKMRKLQEENERLNGKVKALSAENEALNGQLRSLLRHTLGVQVADGQDVKEVFKAFARMTDRQV
eukprot:GFKZ01004777.1.p1 GENE.GFKZ01004777.1~~GFKZ01004777.1.p1  ORF type:complete len:322 (+),score=64.48 GFKZ01004777.1:37-966(+)